MASRITNFSKTAFCGMNEWHFRKTAEITADHHIQISAFCIQLSCVWGFGGENHSPGLTETFSTNRLGPSLWSIQNFT